MQLEYMNNNKLVITMHFFFNFKNKLKNVVEQHLFHCFN